MKVLCVFMDQRVQQTQPRTPYMTFRMTLKERHFLPSEAKHFTTSTSGGASSVSHCDSEAINVEIIQTGCVCLPQACPCRKSHDQSAQDHTSSSCRGKKRKTTAMFIWACCSWKFCATRMFSNRMLSDFGTCVNNYGGFSQLLDYTFPFFCFVIHLFLTPFNNYFFLKLYVMLHILC